MKHRARSSNVIAMIQQRQIRPLAVTGATRDKDLPDVTTMTESGYRRSDFNPTSGRLSSHPSAPHGVVNKAQAEINESLKAPE